MERISDLLLKVHNYAANKTMECIGVYNTNKFQRKLNDIKFDTWMMVDKITFKLWLKTL